MVAVEEVLWNIFTYYSVNGNPRDPSRLHSTSLVKFCRDVMATEVSMTERPLTLADLHLIYTAACKSSERDTATVAHDKRDKLDFEAFLTCIIRIAEKCYPSNRTSEEAMQQLLMDNILPLASRRKPVTIALLLRQPAIETIFKYYEDALREIYKFYTVSSALNHKDKALQRSVTTSAATFDDQFEEMLAMEGETKGKDAVKEVSRGHQMSHPDFIRFANDFGLVTSLGITTMDLADIYLTVTYFQNFTPRLRKIDFKEFWEAMIRCALVAFQEKKSLTTEVKVKGLFLSIWRHIQSSALDHMNGYGQLHGGGFNTYKGALLRGTQLLNDRFVAAWTKDDYCDYLAPLVAPSPAKSPMGRSSGKRGGAPATAMSPNASMKGMSATVGAGSALLQQLRRVGSAVQGEGGEHGCPGFRDQANSSNDLRSRQFSTGSIISSTSMDLGDSIATDKMLKLGLDNVAQSDSFLVPAVSSKGGLIRVMISDYDEFDDRRLNPQAVRQLLYANPAVAELLYDAMIDEGLVEEVLYDHDDDFQTRASPSMMSGYDSSPLRDRKVSIQDQDLMMDDDEDDLMAIMGPPPGGESDGEDEDVVAVENADDL